MKKIDFETNEPLFSLQEVQDLIAVTASIIVEASKKKSTTFQPWSDYIDRWCETNGMPDEIKSHLYETIMSSLKALKR